MAAVEQVSASEAPMFRAGLVDLLRDVVADGASVGFLDPLPAAEAIAYWETVFADLERGRRILLVARDADRVVGSVQVALPAKPNAAHRAEVEKLLVHTAARRRGLGKALMLAAEDAAVGLGRHLLVLDTWAGSAAGRLYERLGYVRAGVIPGYARSPSGRLHGTAIYYRDLRHSDGHVLGETDAQRRDVP
jgi:ribosomal protein S18 acetylase RimI-like enzyme